MAETAGLVIGGIALASLFDSCMNLLRTIETGQNFGDDYQSAALKVVMLSHRLARWERTYRASATGSTTRDGQVAKWALEEIYKQLQAAKNAGEPYLPRDTRSSGGSTIVKVTDNFKAMALRNKPHEASKMTKGRWALRGKDKMDGIISNIEFFIRNLESISGSIAVNARQAAIRSEGHELVQPGAVEEPGTAMPILLEAASAVDPDLSREVEARGNTYTNFKVSDTATSIKGDWVAQGAVVSGYGSTYDNITVSGNAKSFAGNMYGGDNPVASWFK